VRSSVAEVQAPRAAPGAVRWDVVGAGIAGLLVGAAFLVPRLADEKWRKSLFAATAPIFGAWEPHVGWGTIPAIAIAGAVVVYGPAVAARLRWRQLLGLTWVTATCWAFTLAMVDGWHRGFTDKLTSRDEYLSEVPGVRDIPVMLRGFSDRILDFQPDSWTTHVSGHPPGALLIFVLLDRIGLGGGAWAAAFCTAVGASAAVAVLVAVRALGSIEKARAAAPFVALAPAAVWIAVSADAVFAGITAWAVALLALSASGLARWPGAAGAGILFGGGIYVNYGLALMAIPAVAVLIATRNPRPLLPAGVGALAVAAFFTLSGFWWFDGYHLVVQRYYQGIASQRPFSYWAWGNLAALTCATGLAVPAALHRMRDRLGLVIASVLCAVVVADLSALSKAETERIWLPFAVWLLAATAYLPARHRRSWLAVEASGALVLVHLILTNW
jgi:hypothetical protein